MLDEMSRGAVAMAVNWSDPKAGEKRERAQLRRPAAGRVVSREFEFVRIPGIMYDLRIRQEMWRKPLASAE